MKRTILITFRLGVPASLTQTPNRRAHVKKKHTSVAIGRQLPGSGNTTRGPNAS